MSARPAPVLPDHLPAIAPPAQLVAIEPDPRQHCGCVRICADCKAESAYGTDDAQSDVARNLIDADEVGAVVSDLYDAKALMNWIAHNVDLPKDHLPAFRAIDRRVTSIWRSVDELEGANA